MRVFTQIVVVAALATAGGGAWYYQDAPSVAGGGGHRSQRPDRSVLVEVVDARLGDVTVTVEAVGTAQANEAVTITSKVTGIVSKIRFKEGQRVKAGTVLVEMDALQLRAELDEMRAERENAERIYERSRKLLVKRNVAQARVDEAYTPTGRSIAVCRSGTSLLMSADGTLPLEFRCTIRKSV